MNMKPETLSPANNLPPPPVESPEGWTKLRKDFTAANWPKCEADFESMNLSKKLVPLFATALQEEKELATTIDAGQGMEEKHAALKTKLNFLTTSTPKNLDEAEKISSQVEKLKTECNAAIVTYEKSQTAIPKRRHLRTWIPELFDEKPIDKKYAGALSSCIPPPKTFEEASKLKIDVYRLSSWRDLDKPQAEQRRQHTTFAPSNPLFQKGKN
jgi:hypothetical protein